jgi:hypothetical protein
MVNILTTITAPLMSTSSDTHGQKGGSITSYINSIIPAIITITIMVLAGYLCWSCNLRTDLPLRIIYTILAVIFNWIYLIYYLVYRTILNHAC